MFKGLFFKVISFKNNKISFPLHECSDCLLANSLRLAACLTARWVPRFPTAF